MKNGLISPNKSRACVLLSWALYMEAQNFHYKNMSNPKLKCTK